MISVTESDFAFMSEMERYDAFQHLYHSHDPADAELLKRLYESPDPLIPLILLRYLEDLPEKPACLAIIRLIEGGNRVVAKTAMRAYERTHYPGKARLLKQTILSPVYRACRFAVRTLSRAGFMDILPLILREIPERENPILAVMIDALRYLPHRRSIPVLQPFADSADEPTRYLAVDVLAALQARTRALPVTFFLRQLKDDSDRVRSIALQALQRFPSRRVQPMILKLATSKDEPEESRVRAIRALDAFPSVQTVHAVTLLAADEDAAAIRLSSEIVLRSFPEKVLRKGLLPFLEDKDPVRRKQAAFFLAEFLGQDPQVRQVILDLWRGSDELEALDMVDALRTLGGTETIALLRETIGKSPVLAYAAANALAYMRGAEAGRTAFEMCRDPALNPVMRQVLMSRWVKRGPDEAIRDALLPMMLESLTNPVMNIRYVAAQSLVWYPLTDTLPGLLELLVVERNSDVARTATSQISRGLGRNPLPLIEALRTHAEHSRLTSHAVHILLSRSWDILHAGKLMDALCGPPFRLPDEHPKRFIAVCLHLYEHNSVTLQDIWFRLGSRELVRLLLRMLVSAARNPYRRFPLLPLAFLELQITLADPETRRLFYDALAVEGRDEAAEYLAAAIVREQDAEGVRHGVAHLQRLLREEAR
ncbi:MAG: HEAT repeat domain-containing protein [Elusimicrobiota bacterium]